MKLMTKEIRKSLPPLYSTDGQGDEVQDCTSRFVSA